MNDNPLIFDPLNAAPVEGMTYEQAFLELERLIAALESEDHTLDMAVALFERGQCLARHCAGLLDQADLKVQQISGEELVDFNPPA